MPVDVRLFFRYASLNAQRKIVDAMLLSNGQCKRLLVFRSSIHETLAVDSIV